MLVGSLTATGTQYRQTYGGILVSVDLYIFFILL